MERKKNPVKMRLIPKRSPRSQVADPGKPLKIIHANTRETTPLRSMSHMVPVPLNLNAAMMVTIPCAAK
jgi:hypothetical protein